MAKSERNFDMEAQDNAGRKYAYNFDHVIRKFMLRTFRPSFPKGRALEMGCYKGDFTDLLVEYFDEYTVADASQELLSAVKERFGEGINYIHGTFEEMRPSEKYDAIFLLHTLEHVDEPVPVLAKINDWLTDGGRLFVAVPNAHAPSRQIAVNMGLIEDCEAVTPSEAQQGHRRTYTLDTLEGDLVASGLQPLERGGVFFKSLANFQFDKLMETDIISEDYLEGCYKLGMTYPDLCASIYVICEKGR